MFFSLQIFSFQWYRDADQTGGMLGLVGAFVVLHATKSGFLTMKPVIPHMFCLFSMYLKVLILCINILSWPHAFNTVL